MRLKTRLKLSAVAHLFFGAVMIFFGIRYFITGEPLIGGPALFEIGVSGGLIVAGIHDLLKSFVAVQLLRSDNTQNSGTSGSGGADGIPEYGYRDQWERENL